MGQIYGILCPTPRDYCTGSHGTYSASLDKKNIKKHGTHDEAFNCYCQYLQKTGHTRISKREWLQPQGGIMLLSKVAKFGAELRAGKSGETGQGKSRGMPSVRNGGVIIST
jgi:hypothetical protein